ncbi:MAG: glycosyltransferase [Anaerolineae bacterium]|nr:glycosyltransferase [Anaerolineae bacterium]
MRIAVITNSRIPSLTANSIQAMKVCQALAQLGHDIRLHAPRETEFTSWDQLASHYGLSRQFEIEWLPSVPILKRYDFTVYTILATRKFKADLVYTWLLNPAVLALWLGWPVILELHAEVTGKIGPWLMRKFWRSSTSKRMLVTTRPLGKAIETVAGLKIPSDALQIAPNGVDPAQYDSLPDAVEARHQLGLEDKFTVGFTGHIYPGRGADLLFELAKRMPNVNFLWVGGTPDEVAYWRDQLSGAGASNVTMTGFVENSRLPLYQAAADILLMPYTKSISSSSGQDIAEVINPMKMFDYMAAGRAIVSADLPVIHEVLNDGNAVFCEPGNVDAWQRALSELMTDEKRRLKLGKQARMDVAGYTWLARGKRSLEGFGKWP